MEINITNKTKRAKRQVNVTKQNEHFDKKKSHHVTLLRSIDIFIVVEDAGRKCNHRFRRN